MTKKATTEAPETQTPTAIGNYVGKIKLADGSAIEFELRQPTLNDMPTLEELLSSRGYDLSQMSSMPKTEQMFMLFVLLCIRFGENSGVTRDELGSLPMSALMGVTEAVNHFRGQFDL